jgi:hypothetical protein
MSRTIAEGHLPTVSGEAQMVLIAFVLVWAQAAQGAPIKINGAESVMEVRTLNGFVTELSKRITACVDAGNPIETCRCRYPQQVINLRKSYNDFVKRHPDWRDRTLSYEYADNDGRTISGVISIPVLRRQLDGLKCQS